MMMIAYVETKESWKYGEAYEMLVENWCKYPGAVEFQEMICVVQGLE